MKNIGDRIAQLELRAGKAAFVINADDLRRLNEALDNEDVHAATCVIAELFDGEHITPDQLNQIDRQLEAAR